MKNIYGITLEELENYFLEKNDKKFKATQVFDWVYKKRINQFDEMRNVSKQTIETMKKDFCFEKIGIIDKKEDVDVTKYLFKLKDNEKVEAVLMYHDYGNSICISTQVGCNMGCKFCESGRLKKVRNLEVYEMVTQILMVEEDISKRISHIVLMGIGEPLDNYENVTKFIRNINHYAGMNIGARHISLSTCGRAEQIERLADEGLPVTLSVSLHAPNDELRTTLMSINKKYNLKRLFEACDYYVEKTNRRITYEYALIGGVNDSVEIARQLLSLMKKRLSHVNIIPVNSVENTGFKKGNTESINRFRTVLEQGGVTTTVRRELGNDIDAACGQLRRRHAENSK